MNTSNENDQSQVLSFEVGIGDAYVAVLTAMASLKRAEKLLFKTAKPMSLLEEAQTTIRSHVPPEVRVGQVWTDGDPTSTRRITVKAIERERAVCKSSRGNLTVRISLNRFVPGKKGYVLLKDAPAQ